ncbi:polyphenol oxidase, chloroplastic-like isoform X2 [Phalaenopsis equestris]|uniref:polyphenol oxidase, chloroplastic-like isoform X2 n=1 Tax=Phalaenopsis equestris TaxID=78828 RepID=UPI0009E3DF2C|nr:polyphenol oxidase, chloroplastic-like isoform X2 [Phalaenopsis equestris]
MESLTAAARSAFASAAQAPDLSERGLTEIPDGGTPTIIDFIPPPRKGPLRVRRAAHNVDAEHLKKFEEGIELMKALPADDPRSFTRQMDLYHAYRDSAYHQVGLPKLDLQGPNSRFFFPWHRCYLYFYERILSKLIGDDEFSIPFWSMDDPERKVVPDFYNKDHDPNNQKQKPAIHDLGHDSNPSFTERMEDNLKYMHRSMTLIGKSAGLFMGSSNGEGEETNYPGGGSIGQIPHWPAHVRIEEPADSNVDPMGSFFYAWRTWDFGACCANVDRLWSVWEAKGVAHRGDNGEADWFEAYFYFYDEDRQIVRMKVRDCLDTKKLGFKYETVELKSNV